MKLGNNEDNLEKAFQILGLSREATVDELKSRYRQLVKKWHPDVIVHRGKGPTPDKAKAEVYFRKITEAYKLALAYKQVQHLIEKQNLQQDERSPGLSSPVEGRRPDRSFAYTDKPEVKINPRIVALVVGVLAILSVLFLLVRRSSSPPDTSFKEIYRNAPITSVSSVGNPEKAQDANPPVSKNFPSFQASPYKTFFTLGSKEDEIIRVQGKPDRVSGKTWYYGLSRVYFGDDRVTGYDNFDGRLRVFLIPKVIPYRLSGFFFIGSSQDEVILSQGTPSKVTKNTWHYGIDKVFFDPSTTKVVGYDNLTGRLKVRPSQEKLQKKTNKTYFTEGDTYDMVLILNGIPDKVEKERWYYNAFYVIFNNDKVVGVGPTPSEAGVRLKFIPKSN